MCVRVKAPCTQMVLSQHCESCVPFYASRRDNLHTEARHCTNGLNFSSRSQTATCDPKSSLQAPRGRAGPPDTSRHPKSSLEGLRGRAYSHSEARTAAPATLQVYALAFKPCVALDSTSAARPQDRIIWPSGLTLPSSPAPSLTCSRSTPSSRVGAAHPE